MKRVAVIVLSLALAGVPALAYLGEVVASFRAPAPYPLALARANNNLFMWVYCSTSPYRIWQINSENGYVQNYYTSPLGSATRGLAYSYGGAPGGSYLWMGSYTADRVYMCDANNGSAYRSWSAGHDPLGLAPQATGEGGYNPQSIITTDTSPRYTWYHNPMTGSVLRSHTMSPTVYDIAYDFRNRLIWGGWGSPGVVYGWNTTGSLVASFSVPSPYPYAFTYRGQYLWVGCTTPSHYIYKIHCPYNVDVTPSSAGKVKAIFK